MSDILNSDSNLQMLWIFNFCLKTSDVIIVTTIVWLMLQCIDNGCSISHDVYGHVLCSMESPSAVLWSNHAAAAVMLLLRMMVMMLMCVHE